MAYTKVKTSDEIIAIRRSGEILATILTELCERTVVGATGRELDAYAQRRIAEFKVKGPFLGYNGFPATVCISLNDAVVHGIPNDTPFKDGDIVSLDFGISYKGMITDAARTVLVGTHPEAHKLLVRQTEQGLLAGAGKVIDGVKVGTIAAAVQKELDKAKLGIVRDLVGHGVGHELHEEPNIPNYGHANSGPELKAGMTIAIEPMATLGDYGVYMDSDHWTIRTQDGSMAAHFEDTVLVTDDGYEILTRI